MINNNYTLPYQIGVHIVHVTICMNMNKHNTEDLGFPAHDIASRNYGLIDGHMEGASSEYLYTHARFQLARYNYGMDDIYHQLSQNLEKAK